MNNQNKNSVMLIVNPNSGSANPKSTIQSLKNSLWGWNIDFYISESIQETNKYIQSLNPIDYKALLVAGGDGTINRFLPGLIKSNIPLITIPTGTANDLSRELNWTNNIDKISKSLNNSSESSIQQIDVLTANKIPFVTIGGIGIGASLTNYVNQKRSDNKIFQAIWRQYKQKAYTLIAAKQAIFSKKYVQQIKIKTDDFEDSTQISSVFICNQSTLGGNILVCDQSKNNDGVFEVVITSTNNSLEILHALNSSKTKYGVDNSNVLRTKNCSIESSLGNQVNFFGDGEIITTSNVIDITFSPHKLKVMTPMNIAEKKAG